MTVHEKTEDGYLKELHRASGNDCGGTSVDGRFFQMLREILGGPLMKKLKKEDLSAYLTLLREFEAVKRTIVTGKTGKVNIAIPYASLDILCTEMLTKNFETVILSSPFGNKISLCGDKIRIDADLIIKLFEPTIDKILSLMIDILKKVNNVSQILLVGGFSECSLIQDAVMKKFVDTKIIIPVEAGLSVLKGAVLFGHRPDYIQSRVMRFTYGVETTMMFLSSIHDAKHLKEIDGEKVCSNVFVKFFSKNQVVVAGKKVCRGFRTAIPMQKEIRLNVFVSTSEDPIYTDDDSCTKLCEINLELANPSEDERTVDVEFVFGNTEIGIKTIDQNSGNIIKTNVHMI